MNQFYKIHGEKYPYLAGERDLILRMVKNYYVYMQSGGISLRLMRKSIAGLWIHIGSMM